MFPFSEKRITTFALIGESGTGKSFRAQLVAQKYHIDYIIDDGLLIRSGLILAGRSAKMEKSFMAAVKTALFDDKAQRDDVARALQTEKFRKILLLGTSEKMVYKISARLQLPNPSRIIHIEDISSPEEIDRAIRTRKIEGKHVIPVPSQEIKRSYPRIFYKAIRILKRRSITDALGSAPRIHEKSLVRPEYSKRQRVIISDFALSQMVIQCAGEFDHNVQIKKLAVKEDRQGYRIVMTIDVPSGTLGGNINGLQRFVIDNIGRFTGILIEEINVIIDKVIQETQ